MNTASPHVQNKHKHSWSVWAIVLLIIVAVSVIVTSIYNASSSLSERDFSDIEKKMQSVYADMKLSDTETKKICYKYKDSMSNILKCQVEMAAFINFSDPNDLQRIATDYEQSLRILSPKDFTLQKSLRDTGTMIWSGSFIPKAARMPMGCSAKIAAQGGKSVLAVLSESII